MRRNAPIRDVFPAGGMRALPPAIASAESIFTPLQLALTDSWRRRVKKWK
jgi:hypothetical protein